MKKPFSRVALSLTPAVLLALAVAQPAAADRGDSHRLKADPWIYVGTAADCGGTPGSKIVGAGWVKGFGLPDENGKDDDDDDGKRQHNQALQLSKNGPTADCSSAGAEIKGVKGMTLTELGFDIRSSLHCGAGAPRFNVVATDSPTPHFLGGCANGTKTADTPLPGWTRVRIDPANPAQAFPPIAPGATIVSIDILFDEGTDAAADFSGLAIVDNIDVNGTLIGRK